MKGREIFKKKSKGRDSAVKGFTSVFMSIRLVKENKSLIKYFIIPFLINIVVLTSIFYLSYTHLEPWLTGMFAGDAWYLKFLRFIAGPVIFAMLALITILLYSVVGSIITAPFNDILSLKAEEIIWGADFSEDFSLPAFLSDMKRIAMNIVKLFCLLAIVNILLFAVNLVPAAGSVIYSALNFISTAFFLGFQFFDFPLERRRFNFSEKLKIAFKFKFSVTGVGMAFFLISLVPILGYLGLNLAVIGATTVFIEDIKPVIQSQ